jgi:hypothetical protein
MPIPQFHRTLKMRKRRARRDTSVQEGLDVQDSEAEAFERASSSDKLIGGEDCALLQAENADDFPPPREEVPALLSWWPPRRRR